MSATFEGPARIVVDDSAEMNRIHGVSDDLRADRAELQRSCDTQQRISWIQSLAPWQLMGTFTFRPGGSYCYKRKQYVERTIPLDSVNRIFRKWIDKKLPSISAYWAIEPNPSREGYHVHSLWADAQSVYRKEAWADWLKKFGFNRIEPVRSVHDVSQYASKYLCKGDSWYDIRLQWHRLQAIQNRDFVLRPEQPLQPGP